MQPVSVPTSLLIFKDLRVRGFWMSRDGALPPVEVCAPCLQCPHTAIDFNFTRL